MSFQYMLHNRVGLMRKRESFLINYQIIYITDVPHEDLLMVAGDVNCHIGSRHDGFEDEDVMGSFSFGVRSQEGEKCWDCVKNIN